MREEDDYPSILRAQPLYAKASDEGFAARPKGDWPGELLFVLP
jgi:hypothetical protein